MEEKSGDIVHKLCKFNQQLILLWVDENKAVFVAILFLMLCFGIMDTVVFVINNTFLHVTTVGRNVWLDWLFIIITSLLGYGVWKSWIKVEKRIAPKTIALILVPTVLFDHHYSFIKDIQMIVCTVLGKKMMYAGEEI